MRLHVELVTVQVAAVETLERPDKARAEPCHQPIRARIERDGLLGMLESPVNRHKQAAGTGLFCRDDVRCLVCTIVKNFQFVCFNSQWDCRCIGCLGSVCAVHALR